MPNDRKGNSSLDSINTLLRTDSGDRMESWRLDISALFIPRMPCEGECRYLSAI